MRALGAIALACLPLWACSAARPPAPPMAAPRLSEPAQAVPADLDVVLRFDLARLRAALGIAADTLLKRVQEAAPDDEPDSETARLVFALLAHAETLWVAARPGLSAELTDAVIVLRGDFRDVVPSEIGGSPRWSLGRDIGGGVLRFTREAPRLRASPAVLYLRVPDVVVLGSVAEVDALERSVELGAGDTPVHAPDSGLIAAAARLAPLQRRLRQRAPTLAGHLDGAERLEANFDRQGDAFSLRVDVGFEQSEQVSKLAQELTALQGRLREEGHGWVDKVHIEPLERNLALRLALEPAELAALVRCFSKKGC